MKETRESRVARKNRNGWPHPWLDVTLRFALLASVSTTTTTLAFSVARQQRSSHILPERIQQVPERNPTANPAATSPTSGVTYGNVAAGLDRLFPPAQLDVRNAESRRDGYWPFINQGQTPPQQFTYGEFDYYFFAELLDKVQQLVVVDNDDVVFCDIGSGAGRLVVAAAALHPTWKLCRGIELLPSMHEVATNIVQGNCQYDKQGQQQAEEEPYDQQEEDFAKDEVAIDDDGSVQDVRDQESLSTQENVSFRLPVDDDSQFLPMAPLELVCGSFTDPYVYFGDANIIFMFSSALNEELRKELSIAIGRQCQPDTIVITTDYALSLSGTVPAVPGDDRLSEQGSFRFELLEQIDGWCWCTGGQITVYIHRVVESVGMPVALERPTPTLEDICFDVAMKLEKGELKDDRFLVGVANNVRFYVLPEAFVPRSYR